VVQSIALDSVRPDPLVSELGVSTRAQSTLDRRAFLQRRNLPFNSPVGFRASAVSATRRAEKGYL